MFLALHPVNRRSGKATVAPKLLMSVHAYASVESSKEAFHQQLKLALSNLVSHIRGGSCSQINALGAHMLVLLGT